MVRISILTRLIGLIEEKNLVDKNWSSRSSRPSPRYRAALATKNALKEYTREGLINSSDDEGVDRPQQRRQENGQQQQQQNNEGHGDRQQQNCNLRNINDYL